jgi:hypothetical protein
MIFETLMYWVPVQPPERVNDGVRKMKPLSADAVCPAPSRAMTRTRTSEPVGPVRFHGHSVAVAGSPVQPAIGV